MTRDQQVKMFVEGLAVGLLSIGISAITSSKSNLEFAIAHALREWSHAGRFPSLTSFLGANHVWLGIRRSEGRRQVCAAWRDGQWLEPYVTFDGWSAQDCAEHLADTGLVPPDGWAELARLVTDDLGPDRVRH